MLDNYMKILFWFLLGLIVANAQQLDSNCVVSSTPLSQDRPLLDEFRKLYPDQRIQTWGPSNYGSIINTIPRDSSVKNVNMRVLPIWGNESIDWSRGGVTLANVQHGLQKSFREAKKLVPAGGVILAQGPPIVNINSFGTKTCRYKRGVAGKAWAWNSLKYKEQNSVYEIVYFYFGYLDFNLRINGRYYCSWDGEIYLVANRSARVDTSCTLPSKPFTYQVIKGNLDN
ncbi:MAG: hypothetical protein HQK83_10990 [Fibrobacteria bacterium]|nr:hypothetical protein [Fibrobacteria bacterium]